MCGWEGWLGGAEGRGVVHAHKARHGVLKLGGTQREWPLNMSPSIDPVHWKSILQFMPSIITAQTRLYSPHLQRHPLLHVARGEQRRHAPLGREREDGLLRGW